MPEAASRLLGLARSRARAGAQTLLRPPIGSRVRGVVERVDEVALLGSVEVLHPEEEIERRPPCTVDGSRHEVFAMLARHRHPPAFRARLADARVVGAEPLVLTADIRVLLASAFDRVQLDANPVMRRRLPPVRRRPGTHLLLTNQWARNHFHWMLDTLPRAALLPAAELATEPVIVPQGLNAEQIASLQQIGVERARLVPFDGAHLQVGELVFPSFVGGTGNPPRWALRWLRERLVPPAACRERRLYVSRADAAWRRVTNEAELTAALERLGFETIRPGSLPLADQLRAFAEAEVVVGSHGAGLVGLLGAAPDTTVIELFDERYVNGCYYALCDALDLRYWYLLCRGSGRDGLHADVATVERTVAAAGFR